MINIKKSIFIAQKNNSYEEEFNHVMMSFSFCVLQRTFILVFSIACWNALSPVPNCGADATKFSKSDSSHSEENVSVSPFIISVNVNATEPNLQNKIMSWLL